MPDSDTSQVAPGEIRYDNENDEGGGYAAIKYYHQIEPPKLVTWAIKYSGGLIKSREQANRALLILTVLFFLLSLFFFFGAPSLPHFGGSPTQNLNDLQYNSR